MNIVKRIAFLTVFATLTAPVMSASYRLVLQSGHEGSSTDLQWHERSGTVISVGEDGRLIVTDPEKGRVLHRFRVADGRILSVRPDPAGNRAAVVTLGNGEYHISVWNWTEEERVFDYTIESEPLFICWSARGRYLTVGNLGDPSILVLEGRNGRRRSYLQRLPSLYNAGYIGSTETILMTYASSGVIRYWDIRSSALKLSAKTVTDLRDLTVLQIGDKSTLFARRNDILYLINRQTGAVLEQLDVPGLTDVDVDPNTGGVDVLVITPMGASVRQFTVREGAFVEPEFDRPDLLIDPSRNPTAILRGNGKTYVATGKGRLLVSDGPGFDAVVEDRSWRPHALAFGGESLFLSGSGEVIRFTSPFFAADSGGNLDDLGRVFRDLVYIGNVGSDSGIEVLSNGRLLVWNKGERGIGSGIRIFDFDRPAETRFIRIEGAIQKLEVIDPFRLLTVDRSGSVRILGIDNGEVLTSYSALGVLDASYSGEGDFILAGRSNNEQAGTPLESIDVGTGESAPVPDKRFMVYRVVAGPASTYTVGVSRGSGGTQTALLSHDGKSLSRTRLLYSVEGEVMDGMVLPQTTGSGVYTVLNGVVRRIGGGRKTVFNWNEPIEDIRYRGDILYGLDHDGALVLWNGRSGRTLLSVYFFQGGSWIASSPEGNRIWVSSSEVVDNVLFYRDGRQIDPRRVGGLSILSPRV